MKLNLLFQIALLAVVGGNICAQSEKMEALKVIYEKELKKVTDPVDSQYEKALLRLQKKFIAANRLEDALAVKKEIELLKQKKVVKVDRPEAMPSPDVPAETTERETDEVDDGSIRWKGDHVRRSEDGHTTYVLKGRKNGVRMMTTPIEDIGERFPNGLRVRFEYKSDDFEGQGVELRMEFPGLRGLFTYRNPTLRYDGQWNEYLWPFSDTKGQDMMNFQLMLEHGDGSVAFRNLEFLAN